MANSEINTKNQFLSLIHIYIIIIIYFTLSFLFSLYLKLFFTIILEIS